MNVDDRLVEQIIATVLKRIRSAPETVRPAIGNSTSTAAKTTVPIFTENVITSELLEKRLGTFENSTTHTSPLASSRQSGTVVTGRVVLGPKSVLTPSARDFLRARRIEWSRHVSETTQESGGDRTVIVVEPAATVLQVIEGFVSSTAGRWLLERCETTSGGVEAANVAVTRSIKARAVVIADEAELFACQANRNEWIRAAAVHDVAGIERAGNGMQANVYVIRPAGKSYSELRNMLRAIEQQ